MKTEITCVFDRKTNPGFISKIIHGLSLYIKTDDDHILFDMGLVGKYLIKNMNNLGIDPNIITKIIFSHGHSDHVGGLGLFLEHRTNGIPITVYAHPSLKEPKVAHIGAMRMWNAGFYEIDEEQEKKLIYKLSKEPVKINEYLETTGEISFDERKEVTNVSPRFVHEVDGKWSLDPVLDDLSLFLRAKEGIILLCGDCHSGLTNTIRKVERLSGEQVVKVIGGVHFYGSPKTKMREVVERLQTEFKNISLHLNHSILRKEFKFLQKQLGKERVQYLPVGKKFVFES
jgi:7,8-dihydropterin-6-yl-methyl-4-(beta-D-ribofuranosyl)aminobenzene 5'-phosphate synthase